MSPNILVYDMSRESSPQEPKKLNSEPFISGGGWEGAGDDFSASARRVARSRLREVEQILQGSLAHKKQRPPSTLQ